MRLFYVAILLGVGMLISYKIYRIALTLEEYRGVPVVMSAAGLVIILGIFIKAVDYSVKR